MYINADTLPDGITLKGFDICIVGAGAAGIALAQRLIGTNKNVLLVSGDHHMGALRMSAQPTDGIVNPDMKVHTVGNLYIAGSGVYPTGGYTNPTLTIVALALRLADHLKAI